MSLALMALESLHFCGPLKQSVTGKKRYFETSFLGSNSNYGFIKIIGSYASLKSKLADVLKYRCKYH